MNDHHFHYGYLLCAGATIAKFDPTWLEEHNGTCTNGDFLSWFVRDIANPSREDAYFPVTRHRDWFAGHSWASGIANGAGDRDQESLTEAINGYYGCLLYATVTKNEPLRNLARLLIATEQAAAIYWHLDPNARAEDIDEPYPEQGLRNLVTIGNVMQWQAGAWLFWGSQKAQIAAIQILPVTPVNEPYYSARWVRDMLRYVQHELDDPGIGDEWKSVIYLAYANHDPQRAMELSQGLTSWGSGNSYSNQLYFIATRPNPSGRPIWPRAGAGWPEGTFALRCVSTGRYVSSRAGRPELVADADIRAQAAALATAFAPGGVTLRHALTKQFVTADISGEHPLSAAREKVAAWEVFKLVRVDEAAGGDGGETAYVLMAGSNKRYVCVGASGALMPSGETRSAAARFALTSPPEAKNPTGDYFLQDAASGLWVTSDSVGARLAASARSVAGATRFNWTGSGGMAFKSSATGQFITADPQGCAALSAARDVPLAWEHFWVDEAGDDGCFTIRALVNECFVVTDSQRELVNSASRPGDAGRYRFVAAS